MSDTRILTDDMIAEIQAYFPRYPNRRAVTLPALHVILNRLRHVPLQAVVELAELLELAPAEIQDTLSFYGYFPQQQPHGEVRAWVCRSLSCALRGGEQVLEHVCQRLGIQPGQTTADGTLTVEYAECLGACEHAPCMLAGDQLYQRIDARTADELIEAVRSTRSRGQGV